MNLLKKGQFCLKRIMFLGYSAAQIYLKKEKEKNELHFRSCETLALKIDVTQKHLFIVKWWKLRLFTALFKITKVVHFTELLHKYK